MKIRRILALMLALVLVSSAAGRLAATAEELPEKTGPAETKETDYPDELQVGLPTALKGDFFTEMFGNDTADIDVRALIHGYNLVNWNQNQGTYIFDKSVVESVMVAED